MHKPIIIENISLSIANQICFENFSTQIQPGNRIAIIGRNGAGKSSLLNILRKELEPSEGTIILPDDVQTSYVPQIIDDHETISGGQRRNKSLSDAISGNPNLLLLDEPTNHLDAKNKEGLIRMLNRYHGSLIIVSHDLDFIKSTTNILWHIDNNIIHQFTGLYDDYMKEKYTKRQIIQKEILHLKNNKKETHNQLMQEQKRAAKSKSKGEKSVSKKKWPSIVCKIKAEQAQKTYGQKKAFIDQKKQNLNEQLAATILPEIILPKFSINANQCSDGEIILIRAGSVGYANQNMVLENINLQLCGKENIVIKGRNASGKSTLLKAIMQQDSIIKTGDWQLPPSSDIGYLDQNYSTLNSDCSVLEHLQQARPNWKNDEQRQHLNDFLFRKNEDVVKLVSDLSGGEKARLALALIAANTPKLLILDEITNNLDIETKEHVKQVLINFPGALILVSHDESFLAEISVDYVYIAKGRNIKMCSK